LIFANTENSIRSTPLAKASGDATGKKLTEHKKSGAGLNACITFRAAQVGSYRIQATSFNRAPASSH
jgi:hypothetical protein